MQNNVASLGMVAAATATIGWLLRRRWTNRSQPVESGYREEDRAPRTSELRKGNPWPLVLSRICGLVVGVIVVRFLTPPARFIGEAHNQAAVTMVLGVIAVLFTSALRNDDNRGSNQDGTHNRR